MAELIPVGDSEQASADFTLAVGESATLFLKGGIGNYVPAGSQAFVQIKSGGQYLNVGELTAIEGAKVLDAPGTFRVLRAVAAAPFGVDRD
jgi:hypothetical protein